MVWHPSISWGMRDPQNLMEILRSVRVQALKWPASFLLISHWLEVSHMAPPNCQGDWIMSACLAKRKINHVFVTPIPRFYNSYSIFSSGLKISISLPCLKPLIATCCDDIKMQTFDLGYKNHIWSDICVSLWTWILQHFLLFTVCWSPFQL